MIRQNEIPDPKGYTAEYLSRGTGVKSILLTFAKADIGKTLIHCWNDAARKTTRVPNLQDVFLYEGRHTEKPESARDAAVNALAGFVVMDAAEGSSTGPGTAGYGGRGRDYNRGPSNRDRERDNGAFNNRRDDRRNDRGFH